MPYRKELGHFLRMHRNIRACFHGSKPQYEMEDERELSYPLQVYFTVDRFGIIEMPSHSVGNVRANGILSYAADASYRQNAANRLLKRSL